MKFQLTIDIPLSGPMARSVLKEILDTVDPWSASVKDTIKDKNGNVVGEWSIVDREQTPLFV